MAYMSNERKGYHPPHRGVYGMKLKKGDLIEWGFGNVDRFNANCGVHIVLDVTDKNYILDTTSWIGVDAVANWAVNYNGNAPFRFFVKKTKPTCILTENDI